MALDIFKESTQLQILETLQNQHDVLKTFAKQHSIENPAALEAICANGDAANIFKVGDIIYIPWTDRSVDPEVKYDMPFVVTHIGDVYDRHSVLHHNALWLMAMYAEPITISFDAPEINPVTSGTFAEGVHYYTKDGDNYVDATVEVGAEIPDGTTYYANYQANMGGAIHYGYNRWSMCAYRQWLNSDAPKNTGWWTSQHEFDVAPSQTELNKPGWLNGFSNEWKRIFKPVKVQTSTNTVCDGGVTDITYDRFFLPSLEQMYGVPQAAGIEGDYWEYWETVLGFDTPKNGTSTDVHEARQIPSIADMTGAAVSVRLRSAYRGHATSVWLVSTAGYLTYASANTAYRSQPACVIF